MSKEYHDWIIGTTRAAVDEMMTQACKVDMVKAREIHKMATFAINYGTPVPKEPMNQQTVDKAMEALCKAISDKDIREAAEERQARLKRYIELGIATSQLLHVINVSDPQPSERIATFREELAPLAAEFGFNIVLVGDRTTAMLVQA